MHFRQSIDLETNQQPLLPIEFLKAIRGATQFLLQRKSSDIVVEINKVIKVFCFQCWQDLADGFFNGVNFSYVRIRLHNPCETLLGEVMHFYIRQLLLHSPYHRTCQNDVANTAKTDNENLHLANIADSLAGIL